MPIADMRQVVAAIDDRPRHSGGGCTLSKQTPRPAAVASPMGHNRKSASSVCVQPGLRQAGDNLLEVMSALTQIIGEPLNL